MKTRTEIEVLTLARVALSNPLRGNCIVAIAEIDKAIKRKEAQKVEPVGVVVGFEEDTGNAIVDHACEGPIAALEVGDELYTRHSPDLEAAAKQALDALSFAYNACEDDFVMDNKIMPAIGALKDAGIS